MGKNNKKIEVKIEWQKPLSYREVIERYAEWGKKENLGLYQIYGNHIVYGTNVLIYIGAAYGRTSSFGERIKKHKNSWLKRDYVGGNSEPEVRLGYIRYVDQKTPNSYSEENIIRNCEKLLIWWHTPAENSQHIGDEITLDFSLKIENTGARGALQRIVDSEKYPGIRFHLVSRTTRQR